ncbi:MAG: amino acid permease [Planctomycetota bacterium]
MKKEYEKIEIGKSETIVEIKREELLRVLNAKELFATGFGDVGSSIFYALGVVVYYALGATPICLLLASIFFLFVVFSYRELSTTYMISGGAQLFARKAFGDFVSFLAGWALFADYILTVTISAYTAVSYMGAFYSPFKTSETYHIFYTLLLITLLILINIIGIKKSSIFNVILVGASLLVKGILVILGLLLFFNINYLLNLFSIGSISQIYLPSLKDFVYGLTLAMVAFTGIEAISQLGGEARDAKAMGKAILMVAVVAILSSFILSFLAVSAVSPFELKEKWHEDAVYGFVLTLCSKLKSIKMPYFLHNYLSIFADYFPFAVSGLAIVVLTAAANAGVIGGSRLLYSMSHSLQIPHQFRTIHPYFRTPYLSLITIGIISGIIMVFSKRLEILADLYIFGAVLSFLITHLSLISLRFKERYISRPYKTPFNLPLFGYEIPLTAIAGVILTLVALASIYFTRPYGRIFGILWPVIGIPLYVFFRKRAHAPIVSAPEIEEIKFPDYKIPEVKNILMCVKGIEDTEMIIAGCKLARGFGANLEALYVVEIPETLEIEEVENFYFRELPYLKEMMRRIKAIGAEHDLLIKIAVYKSRSYCYVVKDIAQSYDLILLGNTYSKKSGVSTSVDYLLKNITVPIMIFSSKLPPSKRSTILPPQTIKKMFKI